MNTPAPFYLDNLPPLELDKKNISQANDSSQFNAGDVLAKEAESVYRRGLEDMFADYFEKPNPQQAEIMAERAESWKELCEKSYNDVIRLRASWFPWTVSGPARYNSAKNSSKADRQMEVSLQWDQKREAFVANTKKMLRDAIPLSEIVEEYRTGKRDDPISSDDPAAVEKLQARIDYIREQHEKGKAMNKHWRKFGTMKGFPGMEDEKAEVLDAIIKKQLPMWQLPYSKDTANVTATIRRLQERIETIQKQRQQAETGDDLETVYDGFTVRKNLEENRLCIEFDGKPGRGCQGNLEGQWLPLVAPQQGLAKAAYQQRRLCPRKPSHPVHTGFDGEGGERAVSSKTTHVVELWIQRPYKVYIDDPTGSMTEEQMEAAAIARAIDGDENLTLCDDMGIESEDILSVKHEYDLDD